MWRLTFICLLLALLRGSNAACSGENSEYLLSTESLPSDISFVPTLANGQLGYTVYGDSIYMNGIYNGHDGDSRRARIPNWMNVSVDTLSISYQGSQKQFLKPTGTRYEMLLKDGYFRQCDEYTTDGLQLQLEQRTYPHRYHDRALVYELRLQSAVTAKAPLTVTLKQLAGVASDAFDFDVATVTVENTLKFKVIRGTTRMVELEDFQQKPRQIYVVFSDDVTQGRSFNLEVGEKELYYRFIMVADDSLDGALNEMQNILALTPAQMLEKHTAEWNEFWKHFSITVEDNLELSQTINAGIFYLSNSLPTKNAASPVKRPFYGLSPTGLGRGKLDTDYMGHSFWDTEIWMLPPITQFSPSWGEAVLQYRLDHLEGARYNAKATGYKGVRFPWESAYTGTEATNRCCPEVAALQVHISPDIVFAIRQHYIITHDEKWLCNQAWPAVEGVAEFLISRMAYNKFTEKYHIEDVMGPDEEHPHVDDNTYTNVIFKIALEFASLVREKCAPKHHSNDWLEIAERISILYDKDLDYHPQHLGFTFDIEPKQADTIMLGYPLQFSMNASTRYNDLTTYARLTHDQGPAMTWSMFATNFLDINEIEQANMYFERGYKDYIRPEFKVWSEKKVGLIGSVNFNTGIGGFLQTIINGYAGVRFYLEDGKPVMAIHKPHPLPTNQGFTIKGIKFSGAEFSLTIESNKPATLKCVSSGDTKLKFFKGKQIQRIFRGFTASLNTDVVRLRSL